MSNKLATLKYLLWLSLLIYCFFLFFSGANRNIPVSIPIEIFPIPLTASLLLAAYLLKLKNKLFRFLLWTGLLASTASVAWFILIYIAAPYGTEVTIIIYLIALIIIARLQFKKYRVISN